ncbi:hypothetical protein AN394_03470 [Pseudoalteromonas sp. P1-26]|uniref:DUF262 domain-containing protein n=1 Tax=Pseudoalteromonas sp. P1-26 TaxID=1723759 RepID=UPI0006D66CBE|nr:DUF262 domain-containing protein [Pseudoalteromonas sp. P1-26]KPZ67780.1 hypothetical protein AN394_03470 [Pseudoalteromonas sp. P1-26]
MKVEPDYKSIGALFRDANVFRVPKYQRGYAWKNNQLDDFIDDIKNIINDKSSSEHFFGSLVCAQEECIGGHERVNQLVDGQQRLTTFMLLASCLIKKYYNLNEKPNEFSEYISEKITELTERYINYKKSVNKKTEYVRRLELSRRDDEFFFSLVSGTPMEPERDSHIRLKSAEIELDNFLESLTSESTIDKQLDQLDALEKVINESCNVIHMITSKVADAYKLFQVINDRGESLNHTDLLRAKTLGMADDKNSEHIFNHVERIWDDLDKEYGSQLEKLLGYYYSGLTGDKVKSSAFYDQFMDKVIGHTNVKPEKVFEKMNLIYKELNKIHKITNGEWPYSESTLTAWQRNRINVLVKNLKHTHPIPLLAAATQLKESQFYEVVRVLEIFFFRYKHICKNKIDLATTRYLKACRNLNDDSFTVQNFKKDLRELLIKDASDEQFISRLKDLEYIDPKKGDNRSLRYLLLGIEDSWRWFQNGMKEGASGREKNIDYSAVYEFSSITLEHIYPQNAKTANIEMEQDLNKIGNITLLDPQLNSSLGNISYEEKYKFLVNDSKVLLNKAFENYPVWNRESLSNRTEDLLSAAKVIFSF